VLEPFVEVERPFVAPLLVTALEMLTLVKELPKSFSLALISTDFLNTLENLLNIEDSPL